jgi:triphosphatase
VHDADDAVETELKLRLSSTSRVALEHHPAFNPPDASTPQTRHEVTTYFDTPDRTLSSRGATLRVRRRGRSREQTLKVSGEGHGPLQRGEWNWPIKSDVPDLSRLTQTPIVPILPTIRAASLQPMFTTDIQRTARQLHLNKCTTVEAVFDEGDITANGSSLPIAEMELELKSGDVHALYQLALGLLGSVPLALETASKAERGFRLLTGNVPEASKAAPIRIDGHASAEEAFKQIVSSTLTHLLSNVGAAGRGDVEGVHQIRVAVRRLRAALALFKQHLNPVTLGRLNDELRRLGSLFGAARDWDVFVLETLSAAENSIPEATLLDPLRKAAERERLAAHHAVCTELSATSFARVVIGIAASIADGTSDLQRKEDNALNVPIADIAPDLLDRMARKASKRGRHMDRAPHEQLHALRKAIKKLRYSVEFLSSLHPGKQVKAYLRPCKSLQELLGTVNDAAVTLNLSEQLPKTGEDLAPGISPLEDWAATRGKKARHHVSKPWHKLRSADPFWR